LGQGLDQAVGHPELAQDLVPRSRLRRQGKLDQIGLTGFIKLALGLKVGWGKLNSSAHLLSLPIQLLVVTSVENLIFQIDELAN
jgi:hypothetical protein